ncbi:MAG: AraC family ligand binding domain-containing protein, partial [Lachnospiraceae bacterium]|nr:AraC family ligand binding domain-containing protein [Lachnospiraceae bacterium]
MTKGAILFEIEGRTYELHEGDCVFINANFLHAAKTLDKKACSFFAVDFSYAAIEEDIHSSFYKKYLQPVLLGRHILPEYLPLNSDWEIHRELPEVSDGIYEIDHFMDEFSGRPHLSWQ